MKFQRSSNNAFAAKVCVLISIIIIGYVSKPPSAQVASDTDAITPAKAKILPVHQSYTDTTSGMQAVATNPLVKPVSSMAP